MRAWLGLLLLLLFCGCDALFSLRHLTSHDASDDDGSMPDMQSTADARPDTPPGYTCIGTRLSWGPAFCYPPGYQFASGLSFVGPFDTSGCSTLQSQAGGPMICVMAADEITLGRLRAYGPYPLVLVAVSTIQVSGGLDVSSYYPSTDPSTVGAGGYTTPTNACPTTLGGFPGAVNQGAGGGAGGSFVGDGGDGGDGDFGRGGMHASVATTTYIRGGCHGGTGGTGINPGPDGAAGGGAIYLAAGLSISVTGQIYAYGAGGGGGGGGGAGRAEKRRLAARNGHTGTGGEGGTATAGAGGDGTGAAGAAN